MKCKSCGGDNPPEFVWCIQNNTCAGCGEPLFTEPEQELLTELTAAMEQMPNNPQGIVGWLLSNYSVRKIGDAVPVEKFHTKGVPVSNETSVESGKNPFLERAEAYKPLMELKNKARSNSKLAQMAANITAIEEEEAMIEARDQGLVVEESEDDLPYSPQPKLSRALKGGSLVDPNVAPPSQEDLGQIAELVDKDSPDTDYKNLQRLQRAKAQSSFTGGAGSFRR